MDLYSLKDKNILFFLVKNFGSYNLIIDKLKSYGANTIHYDERPASNNFTKGILRVAPRLIKNNIIKYYNSILKDLDKTRLDYVLVIRGEVVPAFFLKRIKELNPNCTLIYYNWDSFKNTSNTSNHLDLYDKSFSFDLEDAKKFNINFLPLFYYDQFKVNLIDSTVKKYDLLFLGTAHSDRYVIVNKLSKWCEKNGLTTYNYFFMQGRLVYFIKRIIDPTFKKFDYKKLSFNSLTTLEMVGFYKQSKVILDINHPYQTGLTMRTFEAIGANKKLITTNSEIKKYPFYNEDNFYIIDREKLVLDKAFFEKDFQPLENSLYQKLSMEGWLESLFTKKNLEYWNKMLRN